MIIEKNENTENYNTLLKVDTIQLCPIPMINCKSGKLHFGIKTKYNRSYFMALKSCLIL